jgi:gliding motility-associated lipoprotein GldH
MNALAYFKLYMFRKYLIPGLCFSLSLASCTRLEVFEKNTVIPQYKWDSNFACSGILNIADTSSYYNMYIVLRHTDAYAYNNIWLNVIMATKKDTVVNQKLDISLATDATGWEGVGMNDIWEQRKRISARPFRFKEKTDYQFTLTHLMRDNPLSGVMSAGIRIEKAGF